MGEAMNSVQRYGWSRYVDFWNEREGPESLALLRITFAAALVGNLLEQVFAGMVSQLYALPEDGGVFPFIAPGRYAPLSLFNLLTPTPFIVWSLVVGQILFSILLMLGLWSRMSSLFCFLIQITLTERMSIWAFGGDRVFSVFLYLMVLSPSGAAWSLDARWRGRRKKDVPCWPRRLFIFQLTVVYVCTGLMKAGSTWSFMGDWSALYLALNLPGIARWPGDWAAWVYPLTQVGTFVAKWWEITFFLVPLSMRQHRRKEEGKKLAPLQRLLARWDLRKPYLFLGLVFHVSLTVLMDLGFFSVVMLSLYPCLLKPEESRFLFSTFLPKK